MNRHKYHSSRRRLTLFVSLMDFADVLNCTATPGGTEAVEKKSTGRVLLCRISVSRVNAPNTRARQSASGTIIGMISCSILGIDVLLRKRNKFGTRHLETAIRRSAFVHAGSVSLSRPIAFR